MITSESIQNVIGRTAYDREHDKIGKVGHVYVDEQTGQPEWMTVLTGLFGQRETFVPLRPAELRDNEVSVPFAKAQVTNAPNVDVDSAGHLSEQDEVMVYQHYGLAHPRVPTEPEKPRRRPGAGEGRRADNAMTRSEEVLHVGTETREAGRAHLRKYVVTEEQQRTVPLHKERVRVEREPVSDQDRQAMGGAEISDADAEVVWHDEHPVVAKETVPKERVRLAKDESTDQETIREQVRKERIEVEGLDDDQRRNPGQAAAGPGNTPGR